MKWKGSSLTAVGVLSPFVVQPLKVVDFHVLGDLFDRILNISASIEGLLRETAVVENAVVHQRFQHQLVVFQLVRLTHLQLDTDQSRQIPMIGS